jgi:hypothetical protein
VTNAVACADRERHHDLLDRHAAEDLRDRKDRDAADEQGDDEEDAAQQRSRARSARSVSGVASRMSYVWLSFSCVMAPAVKDRREQRDQAELEVAHVLEDLRRRLRQVSERCARRCPELTSEKMTRKMSSPR